MDIRGYLMAGEMMTLEHPPLYLTSQRIIRLEERPEGDLYKFLPLERLSSVETVRAPNHRMMVAGSILIVCAVIFFAIGILFFTPYLALVGGVVAFAWGATGKPDYYQVHAHNLTEQEEPLWRLPYWGSGNFATNLHSIIEERSRPYP